MARTMTNHDCFWILSTLSDQELEGRLASLVSSERSATARLVAHLAEVLERRLHLTQAYPTMTAYCRETLHLKEDDAGRRIVAARLGTRYPAIFPMLDSGDLTLSVACKLKHYINDENRAQKRKSSRTELPPVTNPPGGTVAKVAWTRDVAETRSASGAP
jgi:hypothetical protein